jgi:hypothetical protein
MMAFLWSRFCCSQDMAAALLVGCSSVALKTMAEGLVSRSWDGALLIAGDSSWDGLVDEMTA